MLLSMTGYGRSTQTYKDKSITVEVRSLNSKFTDLRIKLPQNYKEKEVGLRKMVLDKAERGKVDLNIDVKSSEGDDEYSLNPALFKKYYQELSKISDDIGMPPSDYMQAILRLPNVVQAGVDTIDEEEWGAVHNAVVEAVDNFIQFRKDEGAAMCKDLEYRVNNITSGLAIIDPHEKERIQKLRQRLQQNLDEYLGRENVDENRFEQEVIFYLEKIDITEEKIRLEQHCKYFLEQVHGKKIQKGRKLSFISQEMGREINTLGAKAYSSDIQKIVVGMKDDLEKIKEQVANIV